jgi:hypothetical protein
MSTIITLDPNNDKTQSIIAMGTYNYTVGTAGLHTVSFAAQVNPVSALTITIQQNGTTKATAAAPATTSTTVNTTGAGSGPKTAAMSPDIGQNNTSLSVLLNCAANDVISIILASAAPNDNQTQGVQGILNIRRGQV